MLKAKSLRMSLERVETDLLVLFCNKDELKKAAAKSRTSSKSLSGVSLTALSTLQGGALLKELKSRKFEAKPGQSALLGTAPTSKFRAVLIISWQEKSFKSQFEQLAAIRKIGNMLWEVAERLHAKSLCLGEKGPDFDQVENCTALLEGILLSAYKFDHYKSSKEVGFKGIEELFVSSAKKVIEKVAPSIQTACDATNFARDLVNLSPLDCSPAYLARRAKEVAKKNRLGIKIFDKAQLQKMGANALLAVAKGSSEPPFLIRLTYRPKGKRNKVVSLVGKGVTFDSGGLSIKTAAGMETMKCDMSGAAAVLAVMQALPSLKPKCEVRAYIPTTENMINGLATRPGDVVKAMSGKTIEILNTDAEGRLILADALCLAERDKCDVIIDLATLTGACMVALGNDYAGLFSDDTKLVDKLTAASELAGERLWRMPLAPEYRDNIKSPVADIKNTGGPYGGAITAALFLKEFVQTEHWAHLDIAGPAFSDSAKAHIKRGGVGFGVRTLLRYLCN